MYKPVLASLVPFALVALLLVPFVAAQETNTPAARVDALFETWDRADAPGAAVAILRDGKVAYKQGYGMANLDYDIPITASTVFDIASVSKQFAAFAIALLADQGLLSLDDPVRKYIPEAPDVAAAVTIRHLVHHTSGLRDWPGTLAMAGWQMEDVISFGQILALVRTQDALNFEPGAEYSYSNTGYNLLAEVVARVTGQTFRAWTDAHLFKPLGMVHTHFYDDHERVIKNRAYAYAPADEGFQRVGNGLTALGSSSLFTTIDDLARWVQNYRDLRVGNRRVMELVHQQGVLNNGDPISYAFGNSIGTYRGLKTVAHSGSWAGFRTRLVRFPDQEIAVIVLSNVSTFNPTRMAWELAEIYLGDMMVPEASSDDESPAAPVDPAILDDYVGTYRLGPGWLVTITREGPSLMTQATGESRFEMRPTSDTRFYVEAYGAAIHFKKDQQGRVTHFDYRGVEAPRVELFEPDTAALAAFAGTYHSEALNATYTIAFEDGRLIARHDRHSPSILSPTITDTFTADTWWFMPSIRFLRDNRRRVTGFAASNSRSRNVHFAKRR